MCREGSKECDGADKVGDKSHGGGYCTNPFSCANGELYNRIPRPHPSTKPKLPISNVPSHEGYSSPELDSLFSFWESFVNPINDIVGLDDIYRISSHGGWKAARYSLNIGVVEAIVQGGRQAYRDSWYEKLTPGQRIIRSFAVGGEALATDIIADKVGKAFRYAGLATLGPLGAAGGDLAGNTFATNVMDQFWSEKTNQYLFSRQVFGDKPQ
jgi:hypothetical protein